MSGNPAVTQWKHSHEKWLSVTNDIWHLKEHFLVITLLTTIKYWSLCNCLVIQIFRMWNRTIPQHLSKTFTTGRRENSLWSSYILIMIHFFTYYYNTFHISDYLETITCCLQENICPCQTSSLKPKTVTLGSMSWYENFDGMHMLDMLSWHTSI